MIQNTYTDKQKKAIEFKVMNRIQEHNNIISAENKEANEKFRKENPLPDDDYTIVWNILKKYNIRPHDGDYAVDDFLNILNNRIVRDIPEGPKPKLTVRNDMHTVMNNVEYYLAKFPDAKIDDVIDGVFKLIIE